MFDLHVPFQLLADENERPPEMWTGVRGPPVGLWTQWGAPKRSGSRGGKKPKAVVDGLALVDADDDADAGPPRCPEPSDNAQPSCEPAANDLSSTGAPFSEASISETQSTVRSSIFRRPTE